MNVRALMDYANTARAAVNAVAESGCELPATMREPYARAIAVLEQTENALEQRQLGMPWLIAIPVLTAILGSTAIIGAAAYHAFQETRGAVRGAFTALQIAGYALLAWWTFNTARNMRRRAA